VAAAALAVGVGTGVTYLAKNYLPHLWRKAAPKEEDNAATKEIKEQMGELRETLAALKTILPQQQQAHNPPAIDTKSAADLEIAELRREIANLSSAVQPAQDEKSKEVADLKAQVATLKASIIARQSAAAPPPITTGSNSRSTSLNWTPADTPVAIPSWQRTLAGPQPQQTQPQTQLQSQQSGPTGTPPPSPPSASADDIHQEGSRQNSEPHPYSKNFQEIVNAVGDKRMTKEELNKRLGIRTDINDKPNNKQTVVAKGAKERPSKPWDSGKVTRSSAAENITTTTTTTSSSDEDEVFTQEKDQVKVEEKDKEKKEKEKEKEEIEAEKERDQSTEQVVEKGEEKVSDTI